MAERLMNALDAGQANGGDTRGMQSAGILVVRPLPPNSDSTSRHRPDVGNYCQAVAIPAPNRTVNG